MSILADLDNPELYAPHFRGGRSSWAAWRAFLAALFGLPMDEDALELYRHHTERTEPPAKPFTEAALIAGRRGGKSRILALIGVHLATFRRHWGKDGSRVLVWRGTSLEMNPTLDRAVVAEAYEEDAAKASAEYGAQFRDDIAAFVTREVVEACVMPGCFEIGRLSPYKYSAFVDPSGGSSDSMTLAIAHEHYGLATLDAVREAKPPFSPESVVRDFADLLHTYGVRSVTGDRYAGEWPRERFREYGISYEPSDRPKSDLYRDMLPLLNSGSAQLLDLPKLITQICALERRTARGGRDSIDHPPGQHDDLANAAAGALLMAGKPKTTYAFSTL